MYHVKDLQFNAIPVEKSNQIEVTYYTDPLCCWSWATEPQWRKFRYQFRHILSVRYCMVGLIPSWKNFTDNSNDVSRTAQMGPVWMEAAQISGMPLHDRLWIDSPPASSYLCCIAVKCAGLQSPNAEEHFLRKLREAVMINGENISLQSVIFKIAAELGNLSPTLFDYNRFIDDMGNEKGLALFKADLQETQSYRITRFPTMIFRKAGQQPLMLQGHKEYASFLNVMKQLSVDTKDLDEIIAADYISYWHNLTNRELLEIQKIIY